MRSFLEAVRPLQPFLGMFIITTIWVLFSKNRICELEPRLLFLLFGTVFSNVCVRIEETKSVCFNWLFKNTKLNSFSFQCRLIVAQMSDTRTDGWNDLLWYILGATILSVTPWHIVKLPGISVAAERFLVMVLTAIATIVHFHYGQGVVIQQILSIISSFLILP